MKDKTMIIYQSFHVLFYFVCILYVYIYGIDTTEVVITKDNLCLIIFLVSIERVKDLTIEILDYRHKNRKNVIR